MENPNHTEAQIIEGWAKFAELVISRCGFGVNNTLQMMRPAFEKVMKGYIDQSELQGKIDQLEELLQYTEESRIHYITSFHIKKIKTQLLLSLSRMQVDD